MIYMYKIAIPPQERPWFVNNGRFPEGMYYLENTALRTSPPNSNQIFFIYIYILKDSRFGILYKSKKSPRRNTCVTYLYIYIKITMLQNDTFKYVYI